MLDTFTLRVVFAVLSLCALLLFYRATFQSTRSAYAGWWCVALLAFGLSAGLFLFNGTDAQVVANPLGNTFGVLGAVCVWASARSLLQRRLPSWIFLALPGLTALAAFVDDPVNDIWTGGAVFLGGMAVAMGGAARDLTVLLGRVVRAGDGSSDDPQYRASLTSIAVMTALFACYYLLRCAIYLVEGVESTLFDRYLGGEVTTLLNIVTLAVAIFSMSALSRAQYIAQLREQATHDGLTGLLNRSEFLRRAAVVAERSSGAKAPVMVVADIDRFKQLNDSHGHSAGDRALAAVGSICRRHLLPGELAGRLGGDEFALVLADLGRARTLAEVVNDEVAIVMGETIPATISFGLAALTPEIDATLERADRALYEAKAGGGRRMVADRRVE